MAKYKLIQKEVEAIQFTGDNLDEVKKWIADKIIVDRGGVFALRSLDGYTLENGDYIVIINESSYGIELAVRKEKDFKEEYEKAN